MEYQIRRYRVDAENMATFVAAWKSGVKPLRERFGFEIVAAFATKDEFTWILAHETFEAADQAYYESEQRRGLEPDPARYLREGTEVMADRIA